MKALALVVVLVLAGCHTTRTWTGGLPPDGRGLTNDQRVHEYAKFAASSLSPKVVTIHEGTKDVYYDFASFRPVTDALDGKIASAIETTENPELGAAVCLIATSILVDAAANRPNGRIAMADYAAAGLVAITGAVLSHVVDGIRDRALRLYHDRLDARIFPH